MSIALRGSVNGTGTTTMPAPTGLTAGDLVIELVAGFPVPVTLAADPNGGLTSFFAQTTAAREIRFGAKTATGAETNFDASAGSYQISTLFAVSDASGVSAPLSNEYGGFVDYLAPSVTPPDDNYWAVIYFCDINDSNTIAVSPPAGWNILGALVDTPGGGSTVAYAKALGAGSAGVPTGTVAFQWTNAAFGLAVTFLISPGGPRVTSVPVSQTAAVGATATFAATDNGVAGITYQWQSAPITSLYSNVPGSVSDISGQTTASYTTGTIVGGDNGYWFRLKYTIASVDAYTPWVRLWVTPQSSAGKGTVMGDRSFVGIAHAYKRRRNYSDALARKSFNVWKDGTDQAQAPIFTAWFFGSLQSYTIQPLAGSYALTGKTANLLRNRTLGSAAGSYLLGGQNAILRRFLNMPSSVGAYALAGQSAGLTRALRLTAASTSFVLNGQTINLKRSIPLVATVGSYVLTGQTVNLNRSLRLLAANATFALGGQQARLLYSRITQFLAGSYAFTGQNITLRKALVIAVQNGAYALTGQDAGMLLGHRLLSAVGAFALTGQAATLALSRRLAAAQGGFSLSGQAAALRKSARLDVGLGAYTFTGKDASLVKITVKTLLADSGAFALTGQDVTFHQSHILHASAGLFSLDGQPINLLRNRSMQVNGGSYALTGEQAQLELFKRLTAAVGQYALIGKDVALVPVYGFVPGVGLFQLIGQDVRLVNESAFVITPERTYYVVGQNRMLQIAAQIRSTVIADQGRTFGVPQQDRTNDIKLGND